MAQGSGSAVVVGSFLAVIAMAVLLYSPSAEAATYSLNWGPFITTWPQKKSFKAGDILIFNYTRGVHSLWVVNKVGYNNCTIPNGSGSHKTGNDKVTLKKGVNYFICGVPIHCWLFGMKMIVNAA